MKNSKTNFKQTEEWEDACVHTRRNLKKRKQRILAFSIKKNDKVLDLGCGDGLNIEIFKELGIKNVVGVDISEKLIKQAKQKNPNTEFYVGSADNLPFKNNSFDVVFVDSVFHHIIDYDLTVKEIKRVLKKNGLLCFIEPHRSILRAILDFICTLSIAKYMPLLRERSIAYLGEINFMKHWISTENEFYDALVRNGFKDNFKKESFLSIVAEYKK